MAALLGLAGWGGAAAGSVEVSATPAAATATPAPGDPAAGRVALEYLQAIFRNDYRAALPLVASGQREVLKALALGDGTGEKPEVSADVAVGEVLVEGDHASVSILGQVCRSQTGGTPDCISNEDPKTDSPIFRLTLLREQGWKVVYNFKQG